MFTFIFTKTGIIYDQLSVSLDDDASSSFVFLSFSHQRIQVNTSVGVLKVDPEDGRVTHDIAEEDVRYDHVILATDLPATQNIIRATTISNHDVNPAVATMYSDLSTDVGRIPIAPPYKVIRVWFDKKITNSPNYNVLQTSQHRPINLVVQYHLLEYEYMEWSQRTGGSVIEFHAYTWSHSNNLTDLEVWDIIAPAAKEIYSEIFDREFRILHLHVYSFQNFASFCSGTELYRPTSGYPQKLGIPNLSFAGDWLHTDYPSALMERAVSTGREAANHILLMDRVRQAPLTVTGSQGPGII